MKVIFKKTTATLVKKALKYFPHEYISLLQKKPSFEESIVGRYCISKMLEKYNMKDNSPYQDIDNKPQKIGIWYWSITHKKGIVFAGIDENPLGVDIEIYRERDKSLFNTFCEEEYHIFGGKNWENFYKIWTIKESILKLFQCDSLDEMKDIQIVSLENTQHKENGLTFSGKVLSVYKGQDTITYIGKKENLYYSISTF